MGKKVGDTVVLQLSKAFDKDRIEYITKDLGLANDKDAAKKYFQLTITKLTLIENAN